MSPGTGRSRFHNEPVHLTVLLWLFVESLGLASDERELLYVTVLGAIIAFLVITYLWWKVLGAFVRIALLVLAFGAILLLLRHLGAL